MRYEFLRLLLALTVNKGWKARQCDIKSAYLHSDLDKLIYMELASGYATPGKVAKLLKSIYGLK